MEQRKLGRPGTVPQREVSVIGLGTWQLGADWGEVDEGQAMAVLDAAVSAGVTFFDTADVYGDGRSEQVIGAYLAKNPSAAVTVATKMGRRAPLDPAEYTMGNFRAWTDRSRRNLRVDTLDLVQLHCPPEAVFHDDAVFDALDELLPIADTAGVAIIARVPLASGLLSGRYRHDTTFAADDHRAYNRHGEAFDVGETFAGVDYDTGVEAAQEFSALVEKYTDDGSTPAQVALHWIAQQPGVTTVIPGARSVAQARANAAAAAIPDLDTELLDQMARLYDRRIRPLVHDRW